VLVRGENVMQGYHNNPEATAEAIRDGWLHTGDLGCIDRRGYLHITGRKKDVIVLSSGKNIYPEEIEKFYQSASPFIKEICVVGVPDTATGDGGEKLHAVVVPDFERLKSELASSAYDAVRWELETLSERLPPYKRVLSLEIRKAPLPLTTTRKIKRFQVQQEVLDRAAKPAAADSAPATPVEERLFALIRAVKDAPAINPSMNLELDLGFTSLERVELLSAIQEAFGARLPDEEAAKIHTVAELAGAVERLQGGAAAGGEEALISWREILHSPLDAEEARLVREVLRHRPVAEPAAWLVAHVIRAVSWALFRLRAEGLKNLPEPPFLLCPNHASFVDAFLLFGLLPSRALRNTFFIGDRSYFKGPVLSTLGSWVKVVTVGADRGVRSSLRLAAEGLGRGMILCVFPEGERTIDGELKAFRKGPAILATELGVPVVPVGIRGSYEVWHRGSSRFRLHPVTYVFGEPLDPAGKSADAFNAELREAVAKLL
jgi:long-chain acyl-CoA synthetase